MIPYVGTVSQAVPAVLSKEGRRHMRTRLLSNSDKQEARRDGPIRMFFVEESVILSLCVFLIAAGTIFLSVYVDNCRIPCHLIA